MALYGSLLKSVEGGRMWNDVERSAISRKIWAQTGAMASDTQKYGSKDTAELANEEVQTSSDVSGMS